MHSCASHIMVVCTSWKRGQSGFSGSCCRLVATLTTKGDCPLFPQFLRTYRKSYSAASGARLASRITMLSRFLPDRTRKHVEDEREWLSKLQRALDRFDTPAADKSALERSIAQLDRLFLLVVIGEFNAGKSAFVNALAGARVLEEGVTPTTTKLQILQYGETPERRADQSGADI